METFNERLEISQQTDKLIKEISRDIKHGQMSVAIDKKPKLRELADKSLSRTKARAERLIDFIEKYKV